MNSIGWTHVRVLRFLEGQPWDDVAKAFVHGLRPSVVRVIRDGVMQTDARLWRVDVAVSSATGLITRVTQEVEVSLPEGIAHGHALNLELDRRGVDRDAI